MHRDVQGLICEDLTRLLQLLQFLLFLKALPLRSRSSENWLGLWLGLCLGLCLDRCHTVEHAGTAGSGIRPFSTRRVRIIAAHVSNPKRVGCRPRQFCPQFYKFPCFLMAEPGAPSGSVAPS